MNPLWVVLLIVGAAAFGAVNVASRRGYDLAKRAWVSWALAAVLAILLGLQVDDRDWVSVALTGVAVLGLLVWIFEHQSKP